MDPKKILAIDDDEKILKVISTILKREGHDVQTCSDPVVGLEIAQAGGHDLLILDVMMPRLDGYQLFEKLRETPTTKDLPVLLLTAKGRYDVIRDKSRYFLYGLYGFLSKPFYGRELAHKVSEILAVAKRESAGPADAGGVDTYSQSDVPTESD